MAPRVGPEPTYYVPPSLDVHPDGVLALGNIFADPLYPEVPLSRQDPTEKLKTTSVSEVPAGPQFEDRTRLEGFKIWTKVLDILQLKLGGSHREHRYIGHWPEKIVTQVLEVPAPAAILSRIKNDAVLKKHLKLGELGLGKPIYMVAGRKVATNVRYSYRSDSNTQFQSSAAATAQPATGANVTAGAEAHVGRGAKEGRAGIIQGDIVFAYKLLEISPKGFWKNKENMGMNIYRKDALLGDGGASEKPGDDDNLDLRWIVATEQVDEEAELVLVEQDGVEEQCVLIVRKDLD
ncbi:hypothetical protein AA0112_g7383 [Alternaria arborescens]|nr:hypothetical protein AA0112_g7383 [Alternaria arborescens]